MAFLDLSSHRLHYRVDGDRGPWLTFCNSLGTDLGMWDAQAEALSGEFRVLRYDRRGHGESTAAPGPYSMADLGGDVHRTDVTAAFCDFQGERGKRCDRPDLLSDRIDGRYGGAR